MTADIEQIKKKIIYRSNYRGTKEMDKLLGAFTSKYLDQLDYKDLNELLNFLEIDDNNLYNFYNGLDTNIKFEQDITLMLFIFFVLIIFTHRGNILNLKNKTESKIKI